MILKIVSYLLLLVFSLIYSINNYTSVYDIICCNVIVLALYGLILYHYEVLLKNKKNIILAVMLAILCSFLTFGELSYSYKKNEIELKNISDGVITIDAVYTDDVKQKLNKKYHSENDKLNTSNKNTAYQRYNKTNEDYKATLYPNESYKIKIKKAKKIKIEFQRDTISYNVSINNNKLTVEKYDYLFNNKALQIYNPDYVYEYHNVDKVVTTLKTIIILLLSFSVYLNIFIRIIDHKKGILLLLFSMLIEFNMLINIASLTKIVLLLIYLLFILRYDGDWKYKNKKEKTLVLITSFYIGFSFFGNNLINNNLNIKTVFIYILFSIWLYLLFPFILNFIDKIKVKNKNKKQRKIWIHRIIVFGIITAIGLIYQLIFNPYIVPPDGYMQINDINNNTLSNWHPYLHTLLMKLFYVIFKDVKYFITFRIFSYALILTKILFYLYHKSLSLIKVYLFAILFTILPVTGILLVTMWKDVDFSLSLVYLTFLLYLLIMNFDYFNKNKFNYLFLLISLIGVGFFRHNGIVVMFFSLIILLIYGLKQKKIWILIIFIVTIIISFINLRLLPQKLKVSAAPPNFSVSTILHGFNRLIYYDNKKLDKEAYDYLITKMPLKRWKETYNKYNIDLLLHYSEYNIREIELDKLKLIKLYLKQFTKTPMELIKDRLYGSDIIWNVSEKDEVMTYKYQIFYDEFENNYSKELNINNKNNIFSDSINNFLVFIAKNELFNSIFFRVGIYIDLLLILIIYIILKKDQKSLICLIPLFINTLTLLFFMHHYEYRYVWNIELIILLFIMLYIYDISNLKKVLKR